MSLAPGTLWPVLHAAPHGGDPLGIAVLVLLWVLVFVAVTGAVLGILVWRYGGRSDEDPGPE